MNIQIDIQNNPEVLKYLKSKFERMGWTIDPNTAFPNHSWLTIENETPRYFRIELENKRFTWWGFEAYGDEDVISTIEDAQGLMRFVELNQHGLKEAPWKYPPYPKQNIDVGEFEDIHFFDKSMSMSYKDTAKFYEEIQKMAKKHETTFMMAEHPKKKSSAKDYPYWADMDEEVKNIQLKIDDKMIATFFKEMKSSKTPDGVQSSEPMFWTSTFSKIINK